MDGLSALRIALVLEALVERGGGHGHEGVEVGEEEFVREGEVDGGVEGGEVVPLLVGIHLQAKLRLL